MRGARREALLEDLTGFWAEHGGLRPRPARAHAREAVCLARTGDELIGASSATAERIPLLGNRTLWLYRMLLVPGAPEELPETLLRASRDTLELEYREGGPIGVCLPIADPGLAARYPHAWWAETKMLYAGYTTDGAQIRVSYFEGARI